VRLLNLRFLNELAATKDRNLKFAALGSVSSDRAIRQWDARGVTFFRDDALACELPPDLAAFNEC
jgi:hypothetical protein